MNATTKMPGHAAAALAVGLVAPFVYFLAGEAGEVPGTTSLAEVLLPNLLGPAYLAFGLFWVSPSWPPGVRRKWPVLTAALAPLFACAVLVFFAEHGSLLPGVPFLASAVVGSVAGVLTADRVGASTPASASPTEAAGRLRKARILLVAALTLMATVAPWVAFGVIPPLEASRHYATGFRPGGVAVILGIAAGLNLLAAAWLVVVAWRSSAPAGYTRRRLGAPAILGLLFALLWAMASGIRTQHPALRLASLVLVACAACDLIAATLITAASVAAGLGPSPAETDALKTRSGIDPRDAFAPNLGLPHLRSHHR